MDASRLLFSEWEPHASRGVTRAHVVVLCWLAPSAIHARDEPALLESGMLIDDPSRARCNMAREDRRNWNP